MKFNPLFLPGNNSVVGSGNSKQSKFNSPSYLFSDIIRLLNDSQPGQKIPMQGENVNTDGSNLFLASQTIKSLLAGENTEITPLVSNGITEVKTVKDNSDPGTTMSINENGQINIPASDSGLEAFLENLFSSLPDSGGIKLNNAADGKIIEGGNNSAGSKLSHNIIDLLKNKDNLTLNINLLNDSALNFNDKQQLVSKVFGTAGDENKSELPAAGEKSSLNRELEKIASLLFGLLSGASPLAQTGTAEQGGEQNTTIKALAPGGSEDAKREIKDTILGLLKEDKPVTLNFNLGDEKLKLEITAGTGESVNPSVSGTQEIKSVQQDLIKPDGTNALNNPGPGNAVKTGEPVQGEKNVSANKSGTKNFNLKITSDSEGKDIKNTGALKELLQKLGADKEDGMKIYTSGNKSPVKSEAPNTVRTAAVENNSNIVVNNTLTGTPVAKPEIPAQPAPDPVTQEDTAKNTAESIAQTAGDAGKKQADVNKNIEKPDVVSGKQAQDSAAGKIVAGLNESTDKESSGESKEDKRFLFDAGTAQVQGKQGAVKNDTAKILPNTNGDGSLPVKAENLMGEISRFLQQGESKSVVLKLKPDTLGKVKIVLDVVDKVVHANIQVENEAVKQVIQGNINTLRQTLNLSGLQLSGFNVSLNSNESGEGRSYGSKKKQPHSGTGSKLTGDVELASVKSMGYNTYDFLA